MKRRIFLSSSAHNSSFSIISQMIFTIEACYIIYLIASAHYAALMYSSDRIINTFPGWASRLFSIYAIMCEASIIVSVVLVFIFGSVKYAAIKHFGIATLILLTGSHFCLALYHIRGVLEQSISKLTSSSSMRGSGMPIRDSSSSQQQHREEESGGYYHRLSDRASDSNSRQPYKAKETSSSTCQTRPFIKQQDIRSKVSIDAFGSDYHTSDKSRGLSLHDQKYPSASSNGIRSLQRRQDGGSILDGSSSHESFSDSQRATSFVYVPESHIRRVKASVNKLKRMIVVFGVVTAAAVPSEYFYGVHEIQSTELYADRCNKESERYNPLTDFAHYLLTIGIYVFQHYAYVRNVNG
mmetsp:Transcript_38874/g.62299  ORF Transcript_38874/g.62299 Transcript_38874/m.62299 type:complete len:353 (+) Transcript_38874:407-1465(+)